MRRSPFRVLTPVVGLVVLASALLVAPSSPAVAVDPAAPAPGSIEECLVRSAIVPVDAEPSEQPAQVREAALRTLQHALLSRHPDALGAADLLRAPDGEGAGIALLAATPFAGELVAEEIAALPSHLRSAVTDDDVDVIGVAAQPLRALCGALDRAVGADGATADALVSAAVDHRSAVLRLGVDRSGALRAAPARAGAIEALPDASAGEGAEPAAADLLSALGLSGLGVPVEMVADVADEPVSRLHDSDGYGGGNAIRVGGLACTTGFAVRTADGAPAVMSAGHCPSPIGSNGASVVSGHASQLCGWGSGAGIGRVSQNLLSTGSKVDSMVVRTGSARPTMWLGSACAGSGETAVHGAGQVGAGQQVGFSGARQGEQYATRTSEPTGCYDFGYWACSVQRAMSSRSTYACLPGDSGGPAFRHRAGGGVIALGLITASGYDLGINRCSWVDMGTALHLSGAAIMTHASLTMAPPARIAGADRYQTAALIAQHGYPDGAAQVYIASGSRFADALSAGAAAAHVRAPLLLTARDLLPSSVRRELDRLAPDAIVLIGGEPSVSAEVEAELAAIAPVTRIGGADRYETSALLAAHAFPEGADHAFVATGRSFPDALAAGPAAARSHAPVLLVDGRTPTAGAGTLDALSTLGTTEVIVVGGTPSVSDAVAASLRDGRTVSRIAGADRYQTAIRVNAGFGARPPAMYVASGERFPDALAAAAVAGARGAPLYLTPGSCLHAGLPAEHTRLGRPGVVLLGGTPTLALDVSRYELCG